jgi:hypothetical protein
MTRLDCPYPPGHPARHGWLVWDASGRKGEEPGLPNDARGRSIHTTRPEYRGRGRPRRDRYEEDA